MEIGKHQFKPSPHFCVWKTFDVIFYIPFLYGEAFFQTFLYPSMAHTFGQWPIYNKNPASRPRSFHFAWFFLVIFTYTHNLSNLGTLMLKHVHVSFTSTFASLGCSHLKASFVAFMKSHSSHPWAFTSMLQRFENIKTSIKTSWAYMKLHVSIFSHTKIED